MTAALIVGAAWLTAIGTGTTALLLIRHKIEGHQ